MGKVIIHHAPEIPPEVAVDYVLHVIKGGNISKTKDIEHPCFYTAWHSGVYVICENRGADKNTFKVGFKTPTQAEKE